VVLGAGPAGLVASTALAERGIEHVVLERDRVAATWRGQRWDSFRLDTAGWMNPMPGGQARDAYAGGQEVVQRLERLAAGCPVREGVRAAAWPGRPRRPVPAHRRRRASPGLWYLGLRWLRRRCSGILLGFPGDAAVVAAAVRANLGG
jgi:phytoene dehydrogenase-like protein